MEESKQIKQANFRINTETADAFRAFCKENGMDQAQGFDHIMQIVELDKAKTVNPNRLTEIEEFERLAKSIIAAYLSSLELANTTEERVREQFQTELKSKDELIIKLQEDLEVKENLLVKAIEENKKSREVAVNAIKDAEGAKEREAAADESIKDKESINAMLQSKLIEAEKRIAGYDELEHTIDNLRSELDIANKTINNNKKDAELAQIKAISELKEEMQRRITDAEKSAAEVKAQAEKDMIITKAEKDTIIATIKLEQADAMSKQAEKYQAKIDSLQEKFNVLQEQISSLNQANK